MEHPSFKDWIVDAGNVAVAIAEEQEIDRPMLILRQPDGKNALNAFGGDLSIGQLLGLMQMLVAVVDPLYAAVVTETWHSTLKPDDPRISDITAGKINLGDLPPEDREDRLILIAEGDVAGAEVRMWSIVNGTSRALTSMDPDMPTQLAMRALWTPIYVYKAGMLKYQHDKETAKREAKAAAAELLAEMDTKSTVLFDTGSMPVH